jgi:hypothetical protein
MKMSDDDAYMPNLPRVLTQFGGTSFRSSSDAQKRVPPRVSGDAKPNRCENLYPIDDGCL